MRRNCAFNFCASYYYIPRSWQWRILVYFESDFFFPSSVSSWNSWSRFCSPNRGRNETKGMKNWCFGRMCDITTRDRTYNCFQPGQTVRPCTFVCVQASAIVNSKRRARVINDNSYGYIDKRVISRDIVCR